MQHDQYKDPDQHHEPGLRDERQDMREQWHIPKTMQDDADQQELQKPEVKKVIRAQGLAALDHCQGRAREASPSHMTTERQGCAQVKHDQTVCLGDVARRLKDGKACTDCRTDQQTVQDILLFGTAQKVGDDDKLADFFGKADQKGTRIVQLLKANEAVDQHRHDERYDATNEEYLRGFKDADIPRCIDLEKENQGRKRHRQSPDEYDPAQPAGCQRPVS